MKARKPICIGSSPQAKVFAGLLAKASGRDVLVLEATKWASPRTERLEVSLPFDSFFQTVVLEGLQEFLQISASAAEDSYVFIFDALSARDFGRLQERLGEGAYYIKEASPRGLPQIAAEFECPWVVSERHGSVLKVAEFGPLSVRGPESRRLVRIFKSYALDVESRALERPSTWSSWACQFSGPA